MKQALAQSSARVGSKPRPRLGFLGVGWIGRQRMEVLAQAEIADIVAIADPLETAAKQAAQAAPGARLAASLEALLAMELDGLVIATPSALHAEQAMAALEQGLAVFCQKPLARTAEETRQVIAAAQRANRLLAVDFSYRSVRGMAAVREAVLGGELGEVYAVDLTFHNAYGPDKRWFYDVTLAGGGCVMDLGTHLVDLALWILDFPQVKNVASALYAQGNRLPKPVEQVEDYAMAHLELSDGASIRLACSWGLAAGQDAVIEAAWYGTRGGEVLRNVNGSFYDFTVERFYGTRRELLATFPDPWGGRALVDWARRLTADGRCDAKTQQLVDIAVTLDRIYGR